MGLHIACRGSRSFPWRRMGSEPANGAANCDTPSGLSIIAQLLKTPFATSRPKNILLVYF